MTSLPDNVFKRSVFAIGTPGAGKSHGVAEGIVIPLLEREQQAVIIDPTDAWFGLALDKSGKKQSGYNITVFGGEHGSVPLTPNMGRAMGELLGKEPISAVLSIWHFSLQEQIEFVSDFSAAIMEVNRKPITLVIDEADEFIPQKPELGNQLLKCKTRTKRIVTRGRKSGFRPILITQRPQALDTAARNGCQVMMAFQCTGHHERTQIEDYVKSNGDPKVMKDMLGSLASLHVGQAWVWAPRDHFLERIQFSKIKVFDSFDAIDENSVSVKTVPVSDKRLATITAALAEFELQRKANDPELLRKRIKELEASIKKAPAPVQAASVTVPNKALLAAARAGGYNEGVDVANKAWERWRKTVSSLFSKFVMSEMPSIADALAKPPELLQLLVDVPTTTQTYAAPAPIVVKAIPDGRYVVDTREQNRPSGVSRSLQKVLDAIAWWESAGFTTPSRAQVANAAGYTVTSGNFKNILSGLSSAGLIHYPQTGSCALTPEGKALTHMQDLPDRSSLYRRVQEIVGNSCWKLLSTLIAIAPADMSRDELARRNNYQPTSGNFKNLLSKMSTLELVTYPKSGCVRAADWLTGD